MPDTYRPLKCIPFSPLIGPNRFISLNRLFALNRINPVPLFDCSELRLAPATDRQAAIFSRYSR